MIHIKKLFFPSLCQRCFCECENFLCDQCLLGVELGEKKGNLINLFAADLSFLMNPMGEYQEIIKSFSLIQLSKHNITFSEIECEPELIFLKKFLLKKYGVDGEKGLFLIHRREKPILKVPITKYDQILLI